MSDPILRGKVGHEHSRPANVELTIDPFDHMSVTVQHDERLPVKQVTLLEAAFCRMPQNEMPEFQRLRILPGSAGGRQRTVMRYEQGQFVGGSERILKSEGVWDEVVKNRKVNSPTADFLVSQLTESKLDAAIVYAANCNFVGDAAEIIRIEHELATAVQPFAVSKSCKYPQMIQRLFIAITTTESQKKFEALKFEWRVDAQEN